jgi:hypothetical protein
LLPSLLAAEAALSLPEPALVQPPVQPLVPLLTLPPPALLPMLPLPALLPELQQLVLLPMLLLQLVPLPTLPPLALLPELQLANLTKIAGPIEIRGGPFGLSEGAFSFLNFSGTYDRLNTYISLC